MRLLLLLLAMPALGTLLAAYEATAPSGETRVPLLGDALHGLRDFVSGAGAPAGQRAQPAGQGPPTEDRDPGPGSAAGAGPGLPEPASQPTLREPPTEPAREGPLEAADAQEAAEAPGERAPGTPPEVPALPDAAQPAGGGGGGGGGVPLPPVDAPAPPPGEPLAAPGLPEAGGAPAEPAKQAGAPDSPSRAQALLVVTVANVRPEIGPVAAAAAPEPGGAVLVFQVRDGNGRDDLRRVEASGEHGEPLPVRRLDEAEVAALPVGALGFDLSGLSATFVAEGLRAEAGERVTLVAVDEPGAEARRELDLGPALVLEAAAGQESSSPDASGDPSAAPGDAGLGTTAPLVLVAGPLLLGRRGRRPNA